LKLGFVQFDCHFGEVSKNLDRATSLISTKKADLWVLPELFSTGYKFISKEEVSSLAEVVPFGPTTTRLIQLAGDLKTSIVAGLAERDGAAFYNSAILVDPKGSVSTYRKIHLFSEEKRWFTPGNLPFKVYDVAYKNADGRDLKAFVGMMICFDWIFPESARTLALLGANVICHPSNLVLPHCPEAMITRCLENRIFTITANRIGTERRGDGALRYIGKSQVVDPGGKVLFRAAEEELAQVVRIDPKVAQNKSINPYNDLLKDRSVDFYKSLSKT